MRATQITGINVVDMATVTRKKYCKCAEPCGFFIRVETTNEEKYLILCRKEANKFITRFLETLLGAEALPELVPVVPWKSQIRELKKLLTQGYSRGQIALKLGRTPKAVSNKIAYMKRHGQL